jgi:protein-tyrosine kinase
VSHLEQALEKADGNRRPQHGTPRFTSPWIFEAPGTKASEPGVVAPPAAPAALKPARRAPAPVETFEKFSPAIREKLAIGPDASPDIREQFRKVAASLYRLREVGPLKIVLIASAVPGEGKTLTATNLALTLGESYGSRVLLLDADLRRPTVHEVFNIPNASGLREGLGAGEGAVVAPVRISEHLEVLTAGRAAMDPMSALTSDRMRSIVEQAATLFDWVLIDTPPVELLPDAKLLSSMADGAILVVQAGSTKAHLAQRAVEAIGRERIVGVVLNRCSTDRVANAARYYGYYGSEATGAR